MNHASDCAIHNEPAYPAGPCDCGADLSPADCRALLPVLAIMNARERFDGLPHPTPEQSPDTPFGRLLTWVEQQSKETP